MASFKKVPALSAESNYAQFGSWKTDLGAYLSRDDMQLWSTLDEAKMPDGYPAEVEEEETDTVEYTLNPFFMVVGDTPVGGPFCGFINAVQIFVLNSVYKTVAIGLNNYENHRTETEYEDALICKVFLFQFVNSFSSFM